MDISQDEKGITLEDSEDERQRIAKAERRASLAEHAEKIKESQARIRRASIQKTELEEQAAANAVAAKGGHNGAEVADSAEGPQ